jgi:GNAT superfamily N-acetyltransferase
MEIRRGDPLGRGQRRPHCCGDVRKIPSPGNLHGRCGYLANSYARPEVRNAGVGSQLLAAIKSWAIGESLELLVVWPSERAYPFYERAGFRRHPDPVVLRLAPPA